MSLDPIPTVVCPSTNCVFTPVMSIIDDVPVGSALVEELNPKPAAPPGRKGMKAARLREGGVLAVAVIDHDRRHLAADPTGGYGQGAARVAAGETARYRRQRVEVDPAVHAQHGTADSHAAVGLGVDRSDRGRRLLHQIQAVRQHVGVVGKREEQVPRAGRRKRREEDVQGDIRRRIRPDFTGNECRPGRRSRRRAPAPPDRAREWCPLEIRPVTGGHDGAVGGRGIHKGRAGGHRCRNTVGGDVVDGGRRAALHIEIVQIHGAAASHLHRAGSRWDRGCRDRTRFRWSPPAAPAGPLGSSGSTISPGPEPDCAAGGSAWV